MCPHSLALAWHLLAAPYTEPVPLDRWMDKWIDGWMDGITVFSLACAVALSPGHKQFLTSLNTTHTTQNNATHMWHVIVILPVIEPWNLSAMRSCTKMPLDDSSMLGNLLQYRLRLSDNNNLQAVILTVNRLLNETNKWKPACTTNTAIVSNSSTILVAEAIASFL